MRDLKILVINYSIPKPDCNAGDKRMFEILKIFAKHHTVDLWLESEDDTLSDFDRQRYENLLVDINVRKLTDRSGVKAILAKSYYHIIFFEFYWTAGEYVVSTCRKYQPHAKIIIDSVDLHFARESLALDLGLVTKEQVEETKKKELNAYASVDLVVAASELDRKLLHEEDENLKIFVIPIIAAIQTQPIGDSTELIFIGGFKWSPNIDGIVWFVEQIWSEIAACLPDTILTIVGSNPTPEIIELGKKPGINVVGYVPDTTPYLQRAAISVAPLRFGAGMKGKVVEAMSLGVPVVTTAVGAQGLKAISGEHLLIADLPQEFAQAVIDLLKDSAYRDRIGLAGQNHAKNLFSPEAVEIEIQHKMMSSLFSGKVKKILMFPWLLHILKIYVADTAIDMARAIGLVKIVKSWREIKTLDRV
jgi:O-antigen biosynthesis protein